MIVLILLVIWAALVALLWGGSLWFQGSIYEQPASEMYWRAPAAGSALALFLALWCLLDYRSVDPAQSDLLYNTLFRFSIPKQRFNELRAVVDGKERLYKLAPDRSKYIEASPLRRPLPTHPEAIIVQEDGEDVRFEPERDKNNKFKIRPGRSLRYLDRHGREMEEDRMGEVSTSPFGSFLGNMLLNLFHFLLWFACLWLLLRYQWLHALGLAAIFWLIMTIVVVPMLLDRVQDTARQRQTVLVSSQWSVVSSKVIETRRARQRLRTTG